MDAIAKGATAGLALLLNMIAMLIVFVALVHLVNAMLGLLPALGGEPITLQRVLGLIMAPVCWLIGIPWSQAPTAGALMGIKTVLNELIAYLEMAKLPADALDPRSRLIMLYAMCGFANFGSVGIMIGGLTVMAPERRSDVISLGMKSIVSGTLSTLLMGAIVGLLTEALASRALPASRLLIAEPDVDGRHKPGHEPLHHALPRAGETRLLSCLRTQCSRNSPSIAFDSAGLISRSARPAPNAAALRASHPERQEALQLGKFREQVVVLPDVGLQQPRVVGPAVEDLRGRQPVTAQSVAGSPSRRFLCCHRPNLRIRHRRLSCLASAMTSLKV